MVMCVVFCSCVFAGLWTGHFCLRNAVFPMWLWSECFAVQESLISGHATFAFLWNYNIHKKSHLPYASWIFFSPSNGIHMGWCVQVNARTMECGLVRHAPKPNESVVTDGEKLFHVQSWNFGFKSSGIRIPHSVSPTRQTLVLWSSVLLCLR